MSENKFKINGGNNQIINGSTFNNSTIKYDSSNSKISELKDLINQAKPLLEKINNYEDKVEIKAMIQDLEDNIKSGNLRPQRLIGLKKVIKEITDKRYEITGILIGITQILQNLPQLR